jgi:GPH family glycoside/pentoside/hexuronide:cation symporter
MKEKLPTSKVIMYAIGQLGWSILINIIGFWQVYFYLPPEGADLPDLIMKVAFLGISTIGVVSAVGRLWDGITDPFIANLSDRWESSSGRRLPFLKIGALPAALFCQLMFAPPDSTVSNWNLAWMMVAMLLFYFFLTVYVTPYSALIAELGHNPTERLNISTAISITYALGIMVAAQIPLIADLVSKNYYDVMFKIHGIFGGGSMEELANNMIGHNLDKFHSYQWAIGILCFLSMVFMYFPVFAIEERRYCDSEPSSVPFKEALMLTFKNKDFLYFSFSDFNYFLSITILTSGMTYYVTVLLLQEESVVSAVLPVMLLTSFVLYPFVNYLARLIGKKLLVMIGFFVFFLVFVIIFFLGKSFMPMSQIAQAYMIVILAAIPMAILGILPNAILADIAELDALKTGSRREGLFFAARTLMQKLGQTIGVLIFSSLLLLGGGVKKEFFEDPITHIRTLDVDHSNIIGVQVTGPVAAGFCILAIILFSRYREKETLEEIDKINKA